MVWLGCGSAAAAAACCALAYACSVDSCSLLQLASSYGPVTPGSIPLVESNTDTVTVNIIRLETLINAPNLFRLGLAELRIILSLSSLR